VEGHVTLSEAGSLILTAPAEPGWHAYVDGLEVEPIKFMGAFLELPLTAGDHEIKLLYRTPGLVAGGVISLVSLAVLVLILLTERKRRELLKC